MTDNVHTADPLGAHSIGWVTTASRLLASSTAADLFRDTNVYAQLARPNVGDMADWRRCAWKRPWPRCLLRASVRFPLAPQARIPLDALTSGLTGFSTFSALVMEYDRYGYRPSIYPTGGWPDLLSWAYDRAQAARGQPARAFPEYDRHTRYIHTIRSTT